MLTRCGGSWTDSKFVVKSMMMMSTHSSRVHFEVLLTPSSRRKHNRVSQQRQAVVNRYLHNMTSFNTSKTTHSSDTCQLPAHHQSNKSNCWLVCKQVSDNTRDHTAGQSILPVQTKTCWTCRLDETKREQWINKLHYTTTAQSRYMQLQQQNHTNWWCSSHTVIVTATYRPAFVLKIITTRFLWQN